jgi:hypothetical protein
MMRLFVNLNCKRGSKASHHIVNLTNFGCWTANFNTASASRFKPCSLGLPSLLPTNNYEMNTYPYHI